MFHRGEESYLTDGCEYLYTIMRLNSFINVFCWKVEQCISESYLKKSKTALAQFVSMKGNIFCQQDI